MAFQDVNQKGTKATGEAVKLTGLKVGGTVTGYPLNFVPSLQNPENMNILMQGEDGSTFYVYTAGNVKYLIKDGKIAKGLLTQIERIADKMVNGKKSSQFRVLQDPDQTISVPAGAVAVTSHAATSDDGSFEAIESTAKLDSKAAIDKAIKNQAAKLTERMGKRN